MASKECDPEIVFQVMAMDPLTATSCTIDQIRAMTREQMEVHKEWSPSLKGALPSDKPLIYKMKLEG